MTEIYKRGSWLEVERYMLSVACQRFTWILSAGGRESKSPHLCF